MTIQHRFGVLSVQTPVGTVTIVAGGQDRLGRTAVDVEIEPGPGDIVRRGPSKMRIARVKS